VNTEYSMMQRKIVIYVVRLQYVVLQSLAIVPETFRIFKVSETE
jgi:hypothetical protein